MDFHPSIDLTLPKQSQNHSHLTPINVLSLIQRFKFSEVSINKTIKLKHKLTVHAINDDNNLSDSGFTVFKNEPHDEIDAALKKQLLNSFNGTNRGLSANSETRAKIVELITQLESKNPTPAPTEALTLLNGKWILAYTSFAGIFPLLSRAGSLSPVKLNEISQTIDSNNITVENTLVFSGPLATTTSISTNSKYEVRSPKLVQIKFEEGVIGTPQLTDSVELPENFELLGQHIDLSPLKGVLNSVQEAASSMAKSISSRGPFKFSIPKSNAESWLLTTYLDKDIRISRGDGGSVFVLIKAGSPLLSP